MFTDSATLTGIRRTTDGYLVAEARVARTGIQEYTGAELGRPDLAVVRVYRPEDQVFSKDAIKTFAHRPITIGHPAKSVSSETWKSVAVGQTGDDVIRDGQFVRVPMVLMDAAAISAIESGMRELSMGYNATIEFGDGVTPDGQPYDAVQKALSMNHLAIVAKARGGSDLKIGDVHLKGSEMVDAIKTKTVLVDGLPIETTDSGAVVIEKLQADVKAAKASFADAETTYAKTLAAKDAEIDALKAKVLTDAALDARVAARASLVTRAKAIVPNLVTDGKADADIRKAAVAAKLGDAVVADKSAAYIDARFDILCEDAPDPVKKALASPGTVLADGDRERAFAENIAYLNNAHKQKESA